MSMAIPSYRCHVESHLRQTSEASTFSEIIIGLPRGRGRRAALAGSQLPIELMRPHAILWKLHGKSHQHACLQLVSMHRSLLCVGAGIASR